MRVQAAVLVFITVIAVPAAAQWNVGFEINATHYRGSSGAANESSGPTTVRPANATTFGVRVDRAIGGGRARLGLQVSYATVGLTAAAPDLTLTDNSSGEVLEGQLLLNFQVVGIGSSGAIRAELGPSLHLWKSDDETRSRAGVVVATAYEWPIASRFSGAIRLEGMLSKSWFEPGDLPSELERRVTWRYGIGLGLRYRL
ncbi:MAG: hypothetical protein DMD38_10205 [Gemmatimonadetes bacterium]|nr:MAG: hypothetical protein AUI09_03870 [Gemmatimonadetes bacterium 13_2_20CM_2_66_5]OLC85399.1 MAG: hypothetical protein AUI86_12440 [Gemmatimonadetes bacterium 13_1_40CM_3_66_12]OLD87276.1 MAG: hypothetical protein AUG85_07730 [Gemmatimonadetes bacterium 13_1_20CM_4_66_11]PYP96075.1 MAG: hypothetical protein DMD38_10205 [Gemmatimonadota bacterium]